MRQISKPEGDYVFHKEDRERIKTRSMLPTETLRYIEALEAVAKAAYNYWSHVNQPQQSNLDSDLYDALAVVDWMDEEKPKPVVALSRGGKFYCLPCMANKQVDGNDEQLTQADVDVWKLHPGWQVLCSGCDKVLSTPDESEINDSTTV